MTRLFNVNFEFNKSIVDEKIAQKIKNKEKGYVCVVDGNVLTNASKYQDYNKIINGSILNVCDGSSIATLGNLIYGQNFSTYVGPEIFNSFSSKNYKQFFLGNTELVLARLKLKFENQGYSTESMVFSTLPFNDVNEFDYESIAQEINIVNSDIIWVSLGAPKQEIFMSKLLPYLDNGVLFGIGAAFNFYINEANSRRAPKIFRVLKLEWFFRLIYEPKKSSGRVWRYLKILPTLIFREIFNENKSINRAPN